MAGLEEGAQGPQGYLEKGIADIELSMLEIGRELATQDNRCTADPMFCVQALQAEPGFPVGWFDRRCWFVHTHGDDPVWVFDEYPTHDDLGLDEDDEMPEDIEEYSYKERWDTVMVAFTERGCEDYLSANGHNVRRQAHKGQVRIYAESFYRCDEMVLIRHYLERRWNERQH